MAPNPAHSQLNRHQLSVCLFLISEAVFKMGCLSQNHNSHIKFSESDSTSSAKINVNTRSCRNLASKIASYLVLLDVSCPMVCSPFCIPR